MTMKSKKRNKAKKLAITIKNGSHYFRPMINGKRVSFNLQTRNYGEAVTKACEILKNQLSFSYKGSLKAAINEFIKHKEEKNRFSANSLIGKKGILMDFAKIVGMTIPIGTLSPSHISKFFTAKCDCAESTKAGYQATLHSFLTWCIDEKKLFIEASKKALQSYTYTIQARKNYLTLEEIQEVINASADDEITYILICGAFLGCRKDEIINSRSCWFKFDAATPVCDIQNLDKSGAEKLGLDPFKVKSKQREVAISPSVHNWLKSFVLGKEQYVIAPDRRKGKHRYRYDYRKKYEAFVKKVSPNKDFGSHTLRHSFATNLAMKNTAIGFIARYLGDSVETTERHYAQFLPTVQSVEVLTINLMPKPAPQPEDLAA
jgi:integrase